MDLENHIKVISSNFVGFNIFIKSKTYRTFRLKTIKPSSGYYKQQCITSVQEIEALRQHKLRIAD